MIENDCLKCGMCTKINKPQKVLPAVFILFIAPIIALMIGYFIAGIGWSLIFLAAYFLALYIYNKLKFRQA